MALGLVPSTTLTRPNFTALFFFRQSADFTYNVFFKPLRTSKKQLPNELFAEYLFLVRPDSFCTGALDFFLFSGLFTSSIVEIR